MPISALAWYFAMQAGSLVLTKVPLVHSSNYDIQKILTVLKEIGGEPKNFCELGAGNGRVVIRFKKFFPKTKCVGYELSPVASWYAKISKFLRQFCNLIRKYQSTGSCHRRHN